MSKVQKNIILAVIFLLPAYLIKIKFGGVSFNLLELLIVALAFVWLFGQDTKYKIQNTRYKIPILLILAGLVLSTLANQNYYSGFGAIKGWFLFPLIFAIVFHRALEKDESLLGKSLLALFWSGVAVSAIGIICKILGIVTYDNRLAIFWASPNQLAMFLAVPFLVGFLRLNLKNYYQIAGIVLIGLNLYFTQSFGAWLGIAVSLAVYFWLKYKEGIKKKYFFVIFIIIIIFVTWAGFAKYENMKSLDERSSLASREMIWKSSLLMAKNNPLFGIGPGNFQNKYLEYQKYFPPYLEWSAPQPHDLFLAFWLESGLVGLVGFVWILTLFFRDNKKATQANRNLGVLFFAIMVYVLIHGLVDTTYWRNDLAVVFWAVIAGNLYLAKK